MTRIHSMYLTVDEPLTLEQEFSEIYKSRHRRVLNLCRYLLNSHDAAEDAAQEVFLKVERALPTTSCHPKRNRTFWNIFPCARVAVSA